MDAYKRGYASHGKSSRLQEVKACGLGSDEHVLGASDVIGPGAVVHHGRGEEAEDLLSYLVTAYLRSYLLHYAGKVAAYGHRELVLHHALQHTGCDSDVKGVDRGGVNADEHLVGENLWSWDFMESEATVETLESDGSHRLLLLRGFLTLLYLTWRCPYQRPSSTT